MNNKEVKIDYTNYKGERAIRTILPLNMFFGLNKWHEGEQWFIEALAIDRDGKLRIFAMNKIHSWGI